MAIGIDGSRCLTGPAMSVPVDDSGQAALMWQ